MEPYKHVTVLVQESWLDNTYRASSSPNTIIIFIRCLQFLHHNLAAVDYQKACNEGTESDRCNSEVRSHALEFFEIQLYNHQDQN